MKNKDYAEEKEWLTTQKAAEKAGVTAQTIRRWISEDLVTWKQPAGPRGHYMVYL